METDNAPRSWRYPAHPRTVLILLQDGSLHKKQVVLPKSRPVLGMPVVFWGCVPSPGFTKSIPRGEQPKDGVFSCLFLQELLILKD